MHIQGGGATLDIGIYPIAMASLVLGDGRPENIQVTGYLTDTGVDELASVTIKYPGIEHHHVKSIAIARYISFSGNKVAQLSYSFNLEFPNETVVRGSGGSIILTIPLSKGSPNIQTSLGKLEFPLPDTDMKLNFPTSRGLR